MYCSRRVTVRTSGFLGSLAPVFRALRNLRSPDAEEWDTRPRREGVEVVVGRTARHLRETVRDEGPGAVVSLDENEPPAAPVGGVLLQDRSGGRATPGEGVEDQRVR